MKDSESNRFKKGEDDFSKEVWIVRFTADTENSEFEDL